MTRNKSSPTRAARDDLTTKVLFSASKDPGKEDQTLWSQEGATTAVEEAVSDAMDIVESIHNNNTNEDDGQAQAQDPSTPHRVRQKKLATKTVLKKHASSTPPVKTTPNGYGCQEGPSNGISDHIQAGLNGIPAKNLFGGGGAAAAPPAVASLFQDTDDPPTTNVTDQTKAPPSPAKVSAVSGSNGVHREYNHSVVDARKSPPAAAQVVAVSAENSSVAAASVSAGTIYPGVTQVSSETDGDDDEDVAASVTDETNYPAAAATAAAEASSTNDGDDDDDDDQDVANDVGLAETVVQSPAAAAVAVAKVSSEKSNNGDQQGVVARLAVAVTVADEEHEDLAAAAAATEVSSAKSNGKKSAAQGATAPSEGRYYLSSDTEDDDYGLIASPSEPSDDNDDDDDDSNDDSEKSVAMAFANADSAETAILIDSEEEDEKSASNDDNPVVVGEGDDNEPAAEPETSSLPGIESSLDLETTTPAKRTPRRRGRPLTESRSSTDGSSSQAATSKEAAKRKSEPTPKRIIENQEERDGYFEPGYLVYSPWPSTDSDVEQWFWGRIKRKFRKPHSHFFLYSIAFLDGDYLEETTAKTMMGVAEYRKLVEAGLLIGTTPAPRGEPDFRDNDGNIASKGCAKDSGSLTPLELYQRRCKECERCLREECGVCLICVQGAVGHQKQCCFQKMCLKINLNEKAQLIRGKTRWRFAFEEEVTNMEYRGLVILAPSNWRRPLRCKSLEAAKRRYPSCVRNSDLSVIYKDMGLSAISIKTEALLEGDSNSLLDLCQVWEKRCKRCDNCCKDDCGQCQTCVQARGSAKTTSCLRRFCCLLSEKNKAQQAAHFPENWRFYFDPKHVDYGLDGLVLLAPSGRRYHSVERAMRRNPKSLGKLVPSPLNFFDYVGLDRNLDDGRMSTGVQSSRDSLSVGDGGLAAVTTGSKKRSCPTESSATKRSKTIVNEVGAASHNQEPPMTPSELFVNRCRQCPLCIADDCGHCATCILNESRTRRFKEVCLRKMCLAIPLHRKKQPAVGFPPDWCYAFELPADSSTNQDDLDRDPDLWGLRLVGPSGLKFYTIGKARRRYTEALGCIDSKLPGFYEHIGASLYEEEPVHALLGRGYCREWINVAGNRRIIFGCITKAEKHLFHDAKKLTVTYNGESRGLLNSLYTGTECSSIHIPPFDRVLEQDAWGGCILYNTKSGLHSALDQKDDLLSVAPFHESWITPDIRHEDQHYDAPNADGSESIEPGLPRLTLVSGGFKLVFTAKPSTIPNAGYGVFLKCVALQATDSPQLFELQAGQLLDFGVYAPFRAEDKKRDHIFLLKNFVHKFKCEGFCFETDEERHMHIFDITDDWTGDLHPHARRHVPAYVNEITDSDEIPAVHSMHDSEGALHYLLGHHEESEGSFQLLADGVEKEIFIDYGPRYENVRVRSGYSRLAPGKATELLESLQKEEYEYLEEIRSFSASELRSSLDFFYRLLTAGRSLNHCCVDRSLIVVILLKKRAGAILEEFSDLTAADPESFCDNGATTTDLPKMVSDAGGLVTRLFDQWGNDQSMMERLLADDIFNAVLQDALSVTRLAQLSSREFRLLIDQI